VEITAVAAGHADGRRASDVAVACHPTSASQKLALNRLRGSGLVPVGQEIGQGWGRSRHVRSAAFGDVDGDGRQELAIARSHGANMRVEVLRGFPHLPRTVGAPIGDGWGDSRTAIVAFGDLDGDGRDELAVGRNPGDNMRFALYRYEGGDWVQMGGDLGEGWGDSRGVSALAFGDVDGNGRDELAVGRNAGDGMRYAPSDAVSGGRCC
jgi:hypothetical protein